ncbi:MAG TPA: hypothetical protein PLC99_05200 [Verrucomicrobiota bacterium]|nr:hypothetical protein [Verrucomicrobiota bacterium]
MVRRLCLIVAVLAGGWLVSQAYAETFKLANGETLTGEALVSSASDAGVQIKVGDGKYERIPWANFSQEDLKKFAKIQKLQPLVEPFIEVTQEEKIKKTEVNIKQPPRLELPASGSLLGALFSSGPGLLIMLLLYAANIYAGYEIAIFRARPPALVCGVSAVLPFAGPIIFLCMPTLIAPAAETWEPAPEAAPAAGGAEAVNPMAAEGAQHPTGLRLAGSGPSEAAAAGHIEGAEAKPSVPETITYQRGQYTFNRRFIETKFPGFFGVIRRDSDRDMVLIIKSARGEHIGQRISRIAANDLHLVVQRGHASEEVMIPFVEIKEIVVKHKDAK